MMLSLLVLATASAAATDFVLVVNASVPDVAVSARVLRRMVSKQDCCWSDGLEVAVVLPPNEDDAMVWFTDTFTGLEPDVFRRYLMERCYRLGCTPLVGVPDLSAAHAVTARTPGAITVARVGEIPVGLRELEIIP